MKRVANVSSTNEGAGILSFSVPFDSFSLLARVLQFDQGTRHPPNRARLPGWSRFVPRAVYSEAMREFLAFTVAVIIPMFSLLWALWSLYANIDAIEDFMDWVWDNFVSASIHILGERLRPALGAVKYILSTANAVLHRFTERFYEFIRPALIMFIPLLQSIGVMLKAFSRVRRSLFRAASPLLNAMVAMAAPIRRMLNAIMVVAAPICGVISGTLARFSAPFCKLVAACGACFQSLRGLLLRTAIFKDVTKVAVFKTTVGKVFKNTANLWKKLQCARHCRRSTKKLGKNIPVDPRNYAGPTTRSRNS